VSISEFGRASGKVGEIENNRPVGEKKDSIETKGFKWSFMFLALGKKGRGENKTGIKYVCRGGRGNVWKAWGKALSHPVEKPPIQFREGIKDIKGEINNTVIGRGVNGKTEERFPSG